MPNAVTVGRRAVLCVPLASIYVTCMLLLGRAFGPMAIVGEMTIGMLVLASCLYLALSLDKANEKGALKVQFLGDLIWSAKWSAYLVIVVALAMGLTERLKF
jgi:uncharacterized membrane protein